MTKTRAQSIRFRLAASYAAVLALTFALVGIGVWIALEHSIQETADRELRSRLADVRHYIDGFSPEDLLHIEEEFREESLLGQFAANIRISDRQGKWLFRTPGTENWPAMVDIGHLADGGSPKTFKVGHQFIRILTADVRVGIAQIGLPLDSFEEVKRGFLWSIVLGSPVLLVVASVGGYWMSGRALQPVDAISQAAAQISPQQLSARLPDRGVDDELDRLSKVLNGMLGRLEIAFKRITEFTADASHELRTPVAIIQTTAELMQGRSRTLDEHHHSWGTVRAETERMSKLLADLLALARSDAGQTDLEFDAMDLSETARNAALEMRVIADCRGVRLTVDAAAPCPIQGDADALRRAVCILLDNAIKFTPASGEVKLTVSRQRTAKITVSDTGVGIEPQALPFIFDRFYRVAKDRNRQTGGTGLGLAIARLIVEGHGGELMAESALQQGSTFTIALPLFD